MQWRPCTLRNAVQEPLFWGATPGQSSLEEEDMLILVVDGDGSNEFGVSPEKSVNAI